MDNVDLLNYALQRRNFLVAMWLTLQQRWFVRSFNSSARVISWLVIAFGMMLVTLTVVTIARNVVPVLTTPGTVPYYLLQSLVLVVSFNIYINYLCATAFSRRIGKAPAEYVYRHPYGADPNALPTDDSTVSSSDDDDDYDSDYDTAAVKSAQQAAQGGPPHGAGRLSSIPTPPPPSRGAGQSPAETRTSAPPQRFGGIQVVRVFGEEEETPYNAQRNFRSHGRDAKDAAALVVVAPSQRTSLHLGDGMNSEMDEEEEDNTSDRRRRGLAGLLSTLRGRCVRFWSYRFGCMGGGGARTRDARSRTCASRCSHLVRVCSCLCPCTRRLLALSSTATSPTAPMGVLHELESLALTAERFGPRQRACRVLDVPRRYCSHCRRLKAPREHHCAICNECVAKMDHHCPWINNCVDVENQRYFLLFITWLWVGTFLAAAFIGYGVVRQQRYTARRAALYERWVRAPAKEALARELQALRMPYGPAGVLLTSFPTIMVLALSITMCTCMTGFVYFNRRLVLENTTVIESIYVEEKRSHVYRATGFVYRNPYDLGWWLNFLDVFSPAGDPLVTTITADLRGTGTGSSRMADGPAGRGVLSRICGAACRVGVAMWLVMLPTLRPTHSDGVHYTTFDALASGEQTSLLRH